MSTETKCNMKSIESTVYILILSFLLFASNDFKICRFCRKFILAFVMCCITHLVCEITINFVHIDNSIRVFCVKKFIIIIMHLNLSI